MQSPQLAGRARTDRVGARGAPVGLHHVDVGHHHERVGTQDLGEQCGREILVDHALRRRGATRSRRRPPGCLRRRRRRRSRRQSSRIRIVSSSTTSRGSGEGTTRRKLDPSAATVHPRSAASRARSASVVDWADGLGRVRRRPDRRGRPRPGSGALPIGDRRRWFPSACSMQVADHPLALGAEHVERYGVVRGRPRPAARASRPEGRSRG